MGEGTGAMLPPGLRVAGVGARLGAWLIDTLLFAVVFFTLIVIASSFGAIRVNPAAEAQLQNNPFALPSVPVYDTNLNLMAFFCVAVVLVNVAYSAFFVARFRGLPGQRMLSLEVADAATGRNLTWKPALVRAVLAVGIPSAGLAGTLFGVLALMSSVPWSEFINPQSGGAADAWMSTWAAPIYISMAAFLIWPVVLLFWTIANSDRQGLHDLAARSQVVHRQKAVWAARPYPQAPYGGAWPPYPHAGYPPAGYPPAGYPPAGNVPPPYWTPGQPPVTPPSLDADEAPSVAAASGQVPSSEPPTDENGQPRHVPPDEMPWVHSWQQPAGPDSPPASRPASAPLWVRSEDDDKPATLKSATVGRRIAAYAMDNIMVLMILLMVSSVLIQTVFQQAQPIDSNHPIEERSAILIGLIGGVIQIIYFVPAWVFSRGTLGQRVLHMVVTDAKTGKGLSWMDAFLRWAILQGPIALYWIVPQALQLVTVIGASLWVSYLLYTAQNSPDWRGIHDRFVNSRVGQE